MKTSKYLYFLLLTICSLSIISCEEDAEDVDTPNYTPRLVVFSFICPSDSIITVYVKTTQNIYGQQTNTPTTLPVKLTLVDGDKQLIFNELNSYDHSYSLKYKVQAGKTYTLKGECTGYPNIEATCKVPEQKTYNISIDTSSIVNTSYDYYNYSYLQHRITMQVTDIPNEVNYYKIYGSMTISQHGTQNKFNLQIGNNTQDEEPIYTLLLSDNMIDGKTIKPIFNVIDYKTEYYESAQFTATVLEVDADYYHYHYSLTTYDNNDNPFSEFSPVYSNVKGGYGVFCSYVKYEKVFIIK